MHSQAAALDKVKEHQTQTKAQNSQTQQRQTSFTNKRPFFAGRSAACGGDRVTQSSDDLEHVQHKCLRKKKQHFVNRKRTPTD